MNKKNDIVSVRDLVGLLQVIVANWLIFVTVPLLAFVGSYIYTHRIQDLHQASCQILLKSNETYDYQEKIYRGLGFGSSYASYEETASQMRVIQSTQMLEAVMQRLPLNVSYFIIGRLKVSEVYKHMPFRVKSDGLNPKFYGTDFYVQILDSASYKLTFSKDDSDVSEVYSFGQLVLDNGLYLRLERQKNLTEVTVQSLKSIDYMFRVHDNGSLISKYKSQLTVKNLEYTSIIQLSLLDEIPERAEEVLDTLASIYVNSTLDNQLDINENTLVYIDRQIKEVINIINEIGAEIEDYKENKQILNLTREEQAYFESLIDIENKKNQLLMSIESLESLNTYLLQSDDVSSLLPPSFYVAQNDPYLKDQIGDLYAKRVEYRQGLEAGTNSNPRMINLAEDIERLKKEVLFYIEDQREAIKGTVSILEKDIVKYEDRIKRIPKTQRQLVNIERRLEVNEELYKYLLSKRAETIIARAGLIPETKIIELARDAGVVYPDKTRMNLIALLISFVLAGAIVFIKEIFFKKITTYGQLKELTTMPVLGSIPRKKDFSGTYRLTNPADKSEIMQSFRSLRTNMQYFSSSTKCKKTLITSLLPGEGKTFVSVNLASVTALAEKKVLIIDFDLHKPRLAKAMQVKNEKGVSTILSGNTNIADCIQKTEIATLDLLTSGPIPPNASELILQEELQSIIDYADEHYEYLFIDSPPISLITDGLILMNHADVKLIVLNSKTSSKASIDYLENLTRDNKIENLSLILNEEQISRVGLYYNRYGYGTYGYSYS